MPGKRGRSPSAGRSTARRRILGPQTKMRRSKKAGPGRASIRATLLDVAEQKRFDWRYDHDGGLINAAWKIDDNILCRLVTGVTNSTRIGDEVYIQSVVVRGILQSRTNTPNLTLRCIASFTDHENIPVTSKGPDMKTTMVNANVSAELLSSQLDEFKQKVVIDKIVQPKYGAMNSITHEGTNDSRPMLVPFEFTIPMNRKIHFKDQSHLSGSNALNLSYFATDMVGGQAIGFLYTGCSIYFKDV